MYLKAATEMHFLLGAEQNKTKKKKKKQYDEHGVLKAVNEW